MTAEPGRQPPPRPAPAPADPAESVRDGEPLGLPESLGVSGQASQLLQLMERSINAASVAVFWVTRDGRFLYVNDAACRLLGYSREELLQLKVPDIDPDFPVERCQTQFDELRRMGEMVFETRARRKNGHIFPIELHDTYVEFGGQGLEFAYIRDISERKATEVALQESEAKFRALFEHSVDGNILLDGIRIVDVNNATAQLAGVDDPSAVIGRTPMDFAPERQPDGRLSSEVAEEALCRAYEDGTFRLEWLARQPSGREVWLDTVLTRLTLAGQQLVFASLRDVSAQRRAESARRELEDRFRLAFDQSAIPMAVIDHTTGRFLSANDAACRMLDYPRDELLALTFQDVTHPDDRGRSECRFREALERGEDHYELEKRYRRRDGETVWVILNISIVRDHAGAITYVLAQTQDVTERRRAEQELARYRSHLEDLVRQRTEELAESRERLRQTERLASLGTLAAGIAHEINNPVGAILLAAEFGLQVKDDPDALALLERSLQDITRDARRCRDIVKSLLQFARHQPTDKWTTDLNDVVRRGVELAQAACSQCGADVQFELAGDLPAPAVNPTEIEQAVANLVRNAAEASPPRARITIRTQRTADGVQLSVEDAGRGMTADEVRRAFDPFFTTRLIQGGSGLGLSVTHGIIAGHGGAIRIDSAVGRGTTVIVDLPLDPGAKYGA